MAEQPELPVGILDFYYENDYADWLSVPRTPGLLVFMQATTSTANGDYHWRVVPPLPRPDHYVDDYVEFLFAMNEHLFGIYTYWYGFAREVAMSMHPR